METYIRLRCNQPPDIMEIDPKHLLESIRKVLDCDTIEITPFAGGLMILDDCGKLTGKPYNPVASLVYQSKRDWIAGDVLLAGSGLRDGEQDIVPLGKNLQEVNLAVANKIWNHIMLEQERMK